MIEVLFGESEAASMKVAKHRTILGRKNDGPTAFIRGREDKPAPNIREAVEWVPGSPDEVICLGFMLDIGDINKAPDSPYRRDLIFSMYSQEQWEEEETGEELNQAIDLYSRELKRLEGYLKAGEDIRIWYSDAPYSRCGLSFVCGWMKGFDNPISVVKMPECRVKERSITFYHNWGEVSAEEFSYFLQFEKQLSKEERRMQEILWAELKQENAPLRAVVNGQLMGVKEDFYDFLIWQRLTRKPVKEGRLIGDILGKTPVGVGDWWYASRIDTFLSDGRIDLVEDSRRKYARMIKRAEL